MKLFILILFYQKDEKYPLEGARRPSELLHRPQSYNGHLEPKRFYTLKVTFTFPEICLNLSRALVPPLLFLTLLIRAELVSVLISCDHTAIWWLHTVIKTGRSLMTVEKI